MLNFEQAPKRATNLSLNSKVLDLAKELGMNISATVDELLAAEVQRRYWERWNEDNREAIADYASRERRYGRTSAQLAPAPQERGR